MAGHWHPSSCRRCDRHKFVAGPISQIGLCVECSTSAVAENLTQLDAHAGPNFERWRERLLASLGVGVFESGSEEAA